MLLKTTRDVFVPAILSKPYLPYVKECPPPAPPPRPPETPAPAALHGCYVKYLLTNVVTKAQAGAFLSVGATPPYSSDPHWVIISANQVCYP